MNLLFDLDGTLTDPFLGITNSFRYALDKLGAEVPAAEHLHWCIGPPLADSFKTLLAADDDSIVEKAVTYYRERFSTVGLFENDAYNGIPDILEALQINGHSLYVATSKPTIFAERIITHFGLNRYFKYIYGSELDGTRVDKTSLIRHILRCELITASDTIMIGDRKHDIIGAKNNGLQGLGVLWGYGTRDELISAGADAVIGQVDELIKVFD